MPRILLAGKHELACGIYDLLAENGDTELAVVHCASERSLDGRASFKDRTSTGKARVLEDDGVLALMSPVTAFEPDLLLSAGFDRIIKPQVLARAPQSLNIHFGMLPKYRGSYSVPWAIMNNEARIGVTLHEIVEGIDDGPIVDQATFENDRSLSCRDLYQRCVVGGIDLLKRHMPAIVAGRRLPATPQDEREASYFSPEFPGGFRISWKQVARHVIDYVRACHFPPYPGAKTVIGAETVELCWPLTASYEGPRHPHGTVVRHNERFWIATLNGLVGPEQVRVDGRSMSFADLVGDRGLEGQRCA